jgi:hypothetical protein
MCFFVLDDPDREQKQVEEERGADPRKEQVKTAM